MKKPGLPRFLVRYYIIIKRSLSEQVIHQSRFLVGTFLRSVLHITDATIPPIILLALGFIVHDIGFRPFYSFSSVTYNVLLASLLVLRVLMVARFISEWRENRRFWTHVFSLSLVVLTFYLYHLLHVVFQTEPLRTNSFMIKKLALYAGIIFLFTTEVSNLLRFIYKRSLNPSFLFVISFAVIILIGGLLLMLPRATVNGISAVNALFTSTSAVCVTGLLAVDTATTFTLGGKIIILLLMQIGGLGIMTFTALLGYIAAGTVSIQSQVALKDMFYSKQINNVIQLVTRIIAVTFFFEFIGFLLINWSIGEEVAKGKFGRLFFSAFHAVSAFCNAGFSTLSNGLYESSVRFNYSVHLIVALLVIFGGMGFPITFNILSLIRIRFMNFIRRILHVPIRETHTHVVHVSSRLAVTTSTLLLVVGFVSYLLFEQHATLVQHPTLWGKIVTAFFGSVTPRTAGFNTVDLTGVTLPTVMIYLLLMWIGASPGSTGGGIKTTTAAVAVLNVASIVRGKNRTEVFRTQISEGSINRAFAIIIVSLLVIGLAVLLIGVEDGEKGMLRIAFEAFSAFSTVGLSLGITQELSVFSKWVLMAVMFVGRVGALTILVSLVQQVRSLHYRYPREEILF
jgi:trk/ktr system potassium uptake protein